MKCILAIFVFSWAFVIGASADSRPNFVIFIADDMSYYDVACWGDPDVKTPNLDRLGSEGMKLTRNYTAAPVCSPTRHLLYTAFYPIKNGGYPNHSAVKTGTKSMVHFLRPLGYRVGIVGKTMIAPEESFPFDQPRSKPAQGKSEHLDFTAIKQYVEQDKTEPFCLVVASHQPHGPWDQGDASIYDPKKLTLPPCIVDTPETREQRAHYLAEVTFLDGEVVSKATSVCKQNWMHQSVSRNI